MKTKLFILSLLIGVVAFGQRKPKIKGSREVVREEIPLPAFKAIELRDDLEILLESSDYERVELEADDNLIDVLKFEVRDSTLVISSFYNITAKKKLEIVVRYRELASINLKDGKTLGRGVLSTDQLWINTYGTSKLDLETRASEVYLNMEDNSSANLNIDTDTLQLNLKDRTNGSVYSVNDGLGVALSGNAKLDLEGTSPVMQADILENGNLRAQKMEAGENYLRVEESAVARVHTYQILELTASGKSRTYLSGNPKIIIHEFQDSAELHKVPD